MIHKILTWLKETRRVWARPLAILGMFAGSVIVARIFSTDGQVLEAWIVYWIIVVACHVAINRFLPDDPHVLSPELTDKSAAIRDMRRPLHEKVKRGADWRPIQFLSTSAVVGIMLAVILYLLTVLSELVKA